MLALLLDRVQAVSESFTLPHRQLSAVSEATTAIKGRSCRLACRGREAVENVKCVWGSRFCNGAVAQAKRCKATAALRNIRQSPEKMRYGVFEPYSTRTTVLRSPSGSTMGFALGHAW